MMLLQDNRTQHCCCQQENPFFNSDIGVDTVYVDWSKRDVQIGIHIVVLFGNDQFQKKRDTDYSPETLLPNLFDLFKSQMAACYEDFLSPVSIESGFCNVWVSATYVKSLYLQ